jgi:hypothetical protein
MASLKGDRARMTLSLRKAPPKPLAIRKIKKSESGEQKFTRIKKSLMGAALAVVITLMLMDYDLPRSGHTLAAVQTLLGLLFIVSLPLVILYRDLRRYRNDITNDFKSLLLIGLVLASSVVICRVSVEIFSAFTASIAADGVRTAYYAVPVAVGATLATLLFDIHIGIVFSFIMSVFAGVLVGSEPLFFVYAFAGSITGAFSVIRCTERTSLLKAGLFIALANVATVAFIDMYRLELFTAAGLHHIIAAFASGIFVGLLVSGLLPLFEQTFKVVTDISLLEYSDLNRPLLKNLMLSAPGTYHHSIMIGTLAESAAESIGVNPLLARVAAYYHDIGKMKKPEYFVENQSKGENRHDRLTPSMSSLIIASHIKDGMDLAKEQKLPTRITDILQQHHGTSLMTFFYNKAREAADESTPVREDDYRYPGPKPQTREAAIVMLADTVEAASRVLDNPTPQRIGALVEKLTNKIYNDGQLSECDLTFKELTLIGKSFTKLLAGIYHYRIDYPGLGIPSGGEKRKIGGQADKQSAGGKGPGWGAKESGRKSAYAAEPSRRGA